MFIFGRDNFKAMAKGKKVYRMASFYQKARKELGLLMDEENKPVGGKWSFDEENRKKIFYCNIIVISNVFNIFHKPEKFKLWRLQIIREKVQISDSDDTLYIKFYSICIKEIKFKIKKLTKLSRIFFNL